MLVCCCSICWLLLLLLLLISSSLSLASALSTCVRRFKTNQDDWFSVVLEFQYSAPKYDVATMSLICPLYDQELHNGEGLFDVKEISAE